MQNRHVLLTLRALEKVGWIILSPLAKAVTSTFVRSLEFCLFLSSPQH